MTIHLNTIPISAIIVPEERQRKEMKRASIDDLKRSIQARGLYHPILLSFDASANTHRLCAGATRLCAITELFEEGYPIRCHRTDVPLGHIPFTLLADLPADEIAEAELEENILRTDLSWSEKVQARATIHALRLKQNPEQSLSETAKELSTKTNETNHTSIYNLRQALAITPHLSNPKIAAAPNAHEAYRRVLDLQANEFKRRLSDFIPAQQNAQLLHGDCRELLPTLADASIDTILCDPPYGIDANKMKKTEKHFYEDSADYALEICKVIISQGFKKLKARGLIFLFCDIDHFIPLREYSKAQGFTAWRTPIIWHKKQHGSAPWGRGGFLRTYETIMLLSKGAKELNTPGSDIIEIAKIGRGEKEHAAEKPEELLTHLLNISCIPGDTVLDPCCGSGSIIPAARKLKLNFFCIEQDQEYYSIALGRLNEKETVDA
jgi:DNA modification methylase